MAVRAPGGETLEGTERLYATDDDGLAAAAEWKGQLEFLCEQWRLDTDAREDADPLAPPAADDTDRPDAHTAARLLGE